MGHKKNFLTLIALLAFGGTALAQNFFDDVYYNPKKDTSVTTAKQKKQSNYISDRANMDVDTYNRRGNQYYISQIDTIGTAVENGEDFIYTQQIQKYYNPTIVVDNANALGDILSNAYGNVDIVINNNGYPVFAPYYGWNWPYYSSVWSPWNWGFSVGSWGWSIGWYDPWYSWGWGPAWGPGPSWAWGPSWGPGWGPAWGPAWRPGPIASWNPHGNRPGGPRPGWSHATQHQPHMGGLNRPAPMGNYNGQGNRTIHSNRVGAFSGSTRPQGVVNNNGKWEYNNSSTNTHRAPGINVNNRGGQTGVSTSNQGIRHNQTSGRVSGSSSSGNNKTVTNKSSNNTNRTTNANRSTGGFNRSTGGAGRSTGGGSRGGGGRHR